MYDVDTAGLYDQLIFWLMVREEQSMTHPHSLTHSLIKSLHHQILLETLTRSIYVLGLGSQIPGWGNRESAVPLPAAGDRGGSIPDAEHPSDFFPVNSGSPWMPR